MVVTSTQNSSVSQIIIRNTGNDQSQLLSIATLAQDQTATEDDSQHKYLSFITEYMDQGDPKISMIQHAQWETQTSNTPRKPKRAETKTLSTKKVKCTNNNT